MKRIQIAWQNQFVNETFRLLFKPQNMYFKKCILDITLHLTFWKKSQKKYYYKHSHKSTFSILEIYHSSFEKYDACIRNILCRIKLWFLKTQEIFKTCRRRFHIQCVCNIINFFQDDELLIITLDISVWYIFHCQCACVRYLLVLFLHIYPH